MKAINHEGIILDHIYTAFGSWLEDLHWEIKDGYSFKANKKSLYNLMNVFSCHINYWATDLSNDEKMKTEVKNEISKMPFLSNMLMSGMLDPEVLINNFTCSSFSDHEIPTFICHNEELVFDINNSTHIVFTDEEFIDFGGYKIDLDIEYANDYGCDCSDWEDEGQEDEFGEITYEEKQGWEYSPSGYTYLFMDEKGQKELIDFLIQAIEKLNDAYKRMGLKKIVCY